MTQVGANNNPLRIAIIGAGPAGFYTADHLLKHKELNIEIDLFDRLPTPFGLVRAGVAPDHQKIKSVTRVYNKVAVNPRLRFYGYVELGKDISVQDLRDHYHQIVYTTGAQTDRQLSIPGADLKGSHPATEFVAWYNGHPDFQDCQFDLSGERAAVIGVGNVAMDVARILSRTVQGLSSTDIADHALEALAQSKIKEVYILGRRGPAQAKFTNPEIKELANMTNCDVIIDPAEVELDDLSRAEALENSKTMKKVEMLKAYTQREAAGKDKKLILRFLVSPVEFFGDENGRIKSMRLVKNELYATDAGTLRPRATEQFEELPIDVVFRSIGYRGVPIPGVPFNDSWGVILNQKGRVINPDTQQPQVGGYTAGWIKRGPSGVIGTNKPDAGETVDIMLKDLTAGKILNPANPEVSAIEALVRQRQPRYFSYEDWQRLDEIEVARGKEQGRPRVKFVNIEDMMTALGK